METVNIGFKPEDITAIHRVAQKALDELTLTPEERETFTNIATSMANIVKVRYPDHVKHLTAPAGRHTPEEHAAQ